MKKFLLFLFTFLIILTFIALTVNPAKYSAVCLSGLNVYATTVLPALLPFIFLTLLLSNVINSKVLAKVFNPVCKFLYRENGLLGYIQIMSFVSGYPIGAKLLSEFARKNAISKSNAEKISVCTSTSGPAFVIASVGAITLNDRFAGIILFMCHILSAVFNGIIFRKYAVYQPIPPLFTSNEKQKNLFYECAFSCFTACLTVGVFVAFFFVFSQVLQDTKLLFPFEFLFSLLFKDTKKATAFVAGLIECTKGCVMMASTKGLLKLPLICAIISFGGISVIVQSVAFLKQANLSVKPFILGKLIQTITSFIICFLFCTFFGYC